MSLVKNTDENRNRLALAAVDQWDMNDLILYAVDMLKEHYRNNDESFQIDFADVISPATSKKMD
jgi:hypothetical protein